MKPSYLIVKEEQFNDNSLLFILNLDNDLNARLMRGLDITTIPDSKTSRVFTAYLCSNTASIYYIKANNSFHKVFTSLLHKYDYMKIESVPDEARPIPYPEARIIVEPTRFQVCIGSRVTPDICFEHYSSWIPLQMVLPEVKIADNV